jgi:hypothetical protein
MTGQSVRNGHQMLGLTAAQSGKQGHTNEFLLTPVTGVRENQKVPTPICTCSWKSQRVKEGRCSGYVNPQNQTCSSILIEQRYRQGESARSYDIDLQLIM